MINKRNSKKFSLFPVILLVSLFASTSGMMNAGFWADLKNEIWFPVKNEEGNNVDVQEEIEKYMNWIDGLEMFDTVIDNMTTNCHFFICNTNLEKKDLEKEAIQNNNVNKEARQIALLKNKIKQALKKARDRKRRLLSIRTPERSKKRAKLFGKCFLGSSIGLATSVALGRVFEQHYFTIGSCSALVGSLISMFGMAVFGNCAGGQTALTCQSKVKNDPILEKEIEAILNDAQKHGFTEK